MSSVWEEVRFYITIPKQSFGSVWTVVEKRDFREVYGPLNGHDSPGAAPVRLQVCVNSRSGFPVRLCSETRSRLDALAVFLILDRDSLSAVRNEWNFLKLFFKKIHSFNWVCGKYRLGTAKRGFRSKPVGPPRRQKGAWLWFKRTFIALSPKPSVAWSRTTPAAENDEMLILNEHSGLVFLSIPYS